MIEPDPVRYLPDHPDTIDPERGAGPDHPMRKITREMAFGGEWAPDRAHKVADLFDGLAAEWTATRVSPTKTVTINDALSRGDVPLTGDWLELGSGTGAGTEVLAGRAGSLVCADLSQEMLRHAPAIAPKIRSDASMLPMPNDSFDAVLLVNMLLFPTEVDRILRPDGVVVWVNTRGDQTPIHLPPSDVVAALPGEWSGVSARAGAGIWLVARRA